MTDIYHYAAHVSIHTPWSIPGTNRSIDLYTPFYRVIMLSVMLLFKSKLFTNISAVDLLGKPCTIYCSLSVIEACKYHFFIERWLGGAGVRVHSICCAISMWCLYATKQHLRLLVRPSEQWRNTIGDCRETVCRSEANLGYKSSWALQWYAFPWAPGKTLYR